MAAIEQKGNNFRVRIKENSNRGGTSKYFKTIEEAEAFLVEKQELLVMNYRLDSMKMKALISRVSYLEKEMASLIKEVRYLIMEKNGLVNK